MPSKPLNSNTIQAPGIVEETKLNDHHIRQLRMLWNKEYPLQLNYERSEDFVLYLMRLEQPRHYFIKTEEGQIVAWAFDFTREGEIWFGIIVDSEQQGKGLGTALLSKLKENNEKLSGWMIDRDTDIKSNGDFYKSPALFYRKNNFNLLPHERMGLDKISAIKIAWSR